MLLVVRAKVHDLDYTLQTCTDSNELGEVAVTTFEGKRLALFILIQALKWYRAWYRVSVVNRWSRKRTEVIFTLQQLIMTILWILFQTAIEQYILLKEGLYCQMNVNFYIEV